MSSPLQLTTDELDPGEYIIVCNWGYNLNHTLTSTNITISSNDTLSKLLSLDKATAYMSSFWIEYYYVKLSDNGKITMKLTTNSSNGYAGVSITCIRL